MGYNTGDTYEEKIYNICLKKHLLPEGFKRAGASAKEPDIQILHESKILNIEVKNNKNPDYGQRIIHYNPLNKTWYWGKQDEVSELFENYNLRDHINQDFEPILYKKRKKGEVSYQIKSAQPYTEEDFKFDQRSFEKPNIKVNNEALFLYYKKRHVFYIQIEDSGLYHLDNDIASLGTSQFNGRLSFRFRLKVHSSKPRHNCSFFGILKLAKKPTLSEFNMEENVLQKFPSIV